MAGLRRGNSGGHGLFDNLYGCGDTAKLVA